MRFLFSVALGAGLGWAWWRFVGCSTGTCPITANPWTSTAYGALMGAAMAGTP